MPDPARLQEENEALRRELKDKAIGRCARYWCTSPGDPYADVHVSASATGYHGFEFKWDPPLALSPERLAEIKAERKAEKAEVWEEGWRAGCRSQEPEIGFQPNPYGSRAATK